MSTEHCLVIGDNASEWITIENTNMATFSHVVSKDVFQWRTNEYVYITCLLYHATCNGNTPREVYLTHIEQTTKEDDSCWVNSPYYFALINRIDVIYLYSNVTCWTRTVKHRYLNILCLGQCSSRLLSTNTQINFCNLGESSQTRLEVFLLTIQLKLEVALQRFITKCRHKDCLWFCVWTCSNSIR